MSASSTASEADIHAPRQYLLELSSKLLKALANVWKALDDLKADNCDVLETACETAWQISRDEYTRITNGLSTDNRYGLQVIMNMGSVPIVLSEVLWKYKVKMAGEAPGERFERTRQAGQEAKLTVEKILNIEKPNFERAEKVSTGANTGTDRSFQHTKESGNTAPSIQPTVESGNTSGQPAKSGHGPAVSIGDLLGGFHLM